MSSRAIVAFRNKLIEAQPSDAKNSVLAASVNHELMHLGYILSADAFTALSKSSTSFLMEQYNGVVGFAQYIKGAANSYKPLWKNFPNDVMNASSYALYAVAIAHYWTSGRFSPDSFSELIKSDRTFKYEHKSFVTLELAGANWMQDVATTLASFPKPLDQMSIADLKWLIENNPSLTLPVITVKETLAVVAAAGGKIKVKNPTDVLRIATAMSGGDVSLSALPKTRKTAKNAYGSASAAVETQQARDAQKFKKFSRPERRMLLGLLEGLKYLDAGDMQPHLGRWTRLAEVLHPGEYSKQFPKTFAAFNELRNQQVVKVRTFAGKVDILFATSPTQAIALLATRAGEFARKLDWLLREHDQNLVLNTFTEIAPQVSTKVLFEMYDHFEGRRRGQPRMVMIKGAGSSSRVLEDLTPLPKTVVDRVQKLIEDQMLLRAAALPSMGNVYIDPELFNLPVPYSMQSSSEGASTLVRGTRFPIEPTTKVLRAFQFWHDKQGRIDVDLAAGFLDADFNLKGECAFYSMTQGDYSWHSGDVRHRAGRVAEYVDVDLAKARKAGVNYVLFNVYNYNGEPMASVPEASFGVMERSAPCSNEIFEPATAKQAIKIAAKSAGCHPVIFDLVNNNWVWLDLETSTSGCGVRLASIDMTALKMKLAAVLGNVKFSIANLLMMHAAARGGNVVDKKEDADISFTMEDLATSYTKLAPYMAI